MNNEMRTIDLLGLRLTTCAPVSAVAHVLELVRRGNVSVGFVNLHTANLSCSRPGYRDVLNSNDVIFNDGIGVELGWRLLGGRAIADLPGNVVVPALLRAWPKHPCRVFLLGSSADVVRLAGEHVAAAFEKVGVSGTHPGFFRLDEEASLVTSINKAGTDVLLVGMGNPHQEEFIARNRAGLEAPVALGVGGLIDIWGNRLSEYPRWATKWRCHWLVRIKQDPGRLWRRYLVGGPVFFARILLSRVTARTRMPTEQSTD